VKVATALWRSQYNGSFWRAERKPFSFANFLQKSPVAFFLTVEVFFPGLIYVKGALGEHARARLSFRVFESAFAARAAASLSLEKQLTISL
jgi:hypothetical protein